MTLSLDYNPLKSTYILRVPKGHSPRPDEIMRDQGMDLSASASNDRESVLFTREPFCAAGFHEFATPAAHAQLAGIMSEVDRSWAIESNAHIACPDGKELMPFQKAGVEYALTRNNTLIGDQPGLGKTMQAICFANEIGAKRVLVICPAGIRLQWAKKIREWSTMPWPMTIYPILKSSHGVHPTAQWTIVSYDLARSEAIGNALARGLYDLMVIDEAHMLKTVDARRTRAVFGGGHSLTHEPLASRAGAILALTGTPLPNRPRECYTLCRGLNFDAIDWMSEESFGERFNPIAEKFKEDPVTGQIKRWKVEGVGRSAELQNRLRYNFMVRRMKRDVLKDLPDLMNEIVYVEETGEIRRALAAEKMLDIDPEDLTGATGDILGHIAAVRKQMGVAKAPLVADYAEMLLQGGEDKLLIFAWHIEVLNILQERLKKFGIVRVDGSTGAIRKQQYVEDFVEQPDIRVFVGNIQSIGTGTDGLQTVCSHALFAESSWVSGENLQATDRLDRMGQTRRMLCEYLVAPNSLDERILSSSLRKLRNTHKALDGHALEQR